MSIQLSPSEIRTEIITHFHNNYTSTPVEWPPNPFNSDSLDEWVSVHIDFNRKSRTVYKGNGLGGNTATRHSGLIHVGVYLKRIQDNTGRSKGTYRVYEIIDDVLAALERQRLNGSSVTTYAGYMDTSNLTDKTGEASFALVTVPFTVT